MTHSDTVKRHNLGPCDVHVTAWPYECPAKNEHPDHIVYECRTHLVWWHEAPDVDRAVFVQDLDSGDERRVDSPDALEPGAYIVGPNGDFYVGPFDSPEAAEAEWDATGRYDGERLHTQPSTGRNPE